jgi:LmbE family N-acetylglucosaminyl deacetylase
LRNARGEAGLSAGLADSPESLADLRGDELRCSAQLLGLSDLYQLDYPDGEGAAWNLDALAQQLAGLIDTVRPTVVVTFDEHGVTRHPDHVAVHRAVQAALDGVPGRLGVQRLFYQVVTCEEMASPEGPEVVCVSLDEIDVSVDTRAYEAIKRVALGCHRTQSADTAHMLALPEGSIVEENYILAWDAAGWQPPPDCGDLFAGLS